MQILVRTSGWCVCSRAKEATVVSGIVIDRHEIREMTEELSVDGQQLDLITVVHIHNNDAGGRIVIGLEEEALPVVDDNVSNDGELHVVE